MLIVVLFLFGFVSGLRALTSPAGASWAAHLGLLTVTGTSFAFMGSKWTVLIFTVLAIGELINDKLPKTPSRKVPPQFIARIVMGALAGGTAGAAHSVLAYGVILGILGAVAGTYGGAWLRAKLTEVTKSAIGAALLEDALAIVLVVTAIRGGA
ncbi:DUF4126 family protein [Terriglobus sp. 2YAB30_2]|uniref:DUF4126 family protein n=1 Tax=unclassified Terriglobus TaxID=2628988 RepID=UPI003F9C56EB